MELKSLVMLGESWYLYHMVTQKLAHLWNDLGYLTCLGCKAFIKISDYLHMCATCRELPSDISTMTRMPAHP